MRIFLPCANTRVIAKIGGDQVQVFYHLEGTISWAKNVVLARASRLLCLVPDRTGVSRGERYQWTPAERTPGSSTPQRAAARQSSSSCWDSWVWPQYHPPAARQKGTVPMSHPGPSNSLSMQSNHHRPEESFGTDPVYSGRCSKQVFLTQSNR